MIDKKLANYIAGYAERSETLNRLLVSAYIKNNGFNVKEGFLKQYLIDDNGELDGLKEIVSLEDVINVFELAIPKDEQTTNGAVYTPQYIREYIVDEVLEKSDCALNRCLCMDVSCGCGAFLYTLAEYIHSKTNLPFSEIVGRIYGVDISGTSIERAKILLSLAALNNGEELDEKAFRLYVGDSLTFDFKSLPNVADNGGFDVIVGNPPYVRSKHIDPQTKANLPLWSTAKVGNADLYIPFFEIGYSLLNDKGRLGYITVNSFFKSVNARALRRFFEEREVALSIVDFGQQLVFKKKLAYTCLAFMSKEPSAQLKYVKARIGDVQKRKTFAYSAIEYNSLDCHRGWNLNKVDVLENIRRIEEAGEPLGNKYVIKNGIATLANNIYIFRPTVADATYYYMERDGKCYQIERGVCRDIIKPNILKSESDIKEKEEKIIFPYDAEYNVLPEKLLKDKYPYAYKYLLTYKDVLDARDKGEGDYGAWYAFGRTQALTDCGRKLLFPYISDLPHFVYTSQQDMLIYCGYAIYNDSETELLILKKLLESSVFDYYIRNTSKPYSTGYYSYAKNYVKSFGVYPFTEKERQQLLSLNDRSAINDFVARRYRVVI